MWTLTSAVEAHMTGIQPCNLYHGSELGLPRVEIVLTICTYSDSDRSEYLKH